MGQGAAVHADDQVMTCRQCCHGFGVWAVAFCDSVGHIEGGLNGKLLQKINQQRRRAAAVHIIIGKNCNFLLILNGGEQDLCRFGAVFERLRITHTGAEGGIEELGNLRLSYTQAGQHIAQRQGQITVLVERQSITFNRERWSKPPAVGNRLIDAQIHSSVRARGRSCAALSRFLTASKWFQWSKNPARA